ncbi:AraC-like DNA-binding protein [Filimonas zeae]|uniref:AraC family transcriptional regulator n=1 Tax=Filimonas zeae TaxID=1737353 RepID=A0A917J5C7_9BACT|nr:helix-turn-helix transcriptional regulator [Filimonas zeae]MDR6342011.1 AraC-like DNA-binding protein [Filimonas zeae]GGH79464.1 AraC family transcriptional regulator [Filimonas zeae]
MSNTIHTTEAPVEATMGREQSNAMRIFDLSSFIAQSCASRTSMVKENSFLIFWVEEGGGSFLVDMKEQVVTCSTVYCIYPGQSLQFESLMSAKGLVLSFTADFCSLNDDLTRLLYSGVFKAYGMIAMEVHDEVKAELMQLLQSMVKEYFSVSEFRNEMMHTLLKVFLIQLSRLADHSLLQDNDMQNDVSLVTKFLEMIDVHFLTLKKVSDYAERLSIAPNYLNIKVKKVSGYTAGYHIRQRIVLEAKRQAHWDSMSLKEISYKLGYNDVAHFSKFFKKEAGVSFSSFKRIQHAF